MKSNIDWLIHWLIDLIPSVSFKDETYLGEDIQYTVADTIQRITEKVELKYRDTSSSLGQHTSNLGQHTNSFGQHTSSLGQQTNSLGQHTSSLGQQTNSFRQHTSSLGQQASCDDEQSIPICREPTAEGVEDDQDGVEEEEEEDEVREVPINVLEVPHGTRVTHSF